MAKVVLIKDLAEFKPSITNIIISSMIGNTDIDKFDPNVSYKPGDKIYVIEDGKIIVKECINNNVTNLDDKNWIIVDSGIGGNSSTQNPNSHQNISYFENKLATDIGMLTSRLNTLTNLDDENLTNMHMVPLYDLSDVVLTKGRFEFGRIFV